MKPAAIAFVALLASCTRTPLSGDLQVTNAWAQPVTGDGRSAAVYMTIIAKCPQNDTLQSLAAPSPLQASLHSARVVDNALKMTPVRSIAIPCGKPVLLKPMDRHVMIVGLQKPAAIGDRLPVTLHFTNAGDVPVTAEVTSLAVLENVDPMHMHGAHSSGTMQMDHMTMH